MYVRAVRFTGVTPEQVDTVLARIQESGGPPPGVSVARLELLFDADQSTAIVLQHFDTTEAMEEAARVFEAMDSSDTPGARASVDTCEVKLSISPS